jgi:glycosyltransferase involved in cell wall biosynthesis
VLPVYNAEAYLPQALESVAAQTFGEFTVIAIDDGSTDGSKAILERFAERDPRFRVISRPNKGLVVTLGEGLGLCETEFVARMDADDVSRPQRFEKQVRFLNEHPDHVAVGCRLLLTDPDGAPIREMSSRQAHEEIESALLEGEAGAMPHAASMFRREAVVAVGGYREAYFPAEDLDLFLRLAEHGKLANLPEVLYEYRMHAASIGSTQAERQHRVMKAAIEAGRQRRGMAPLPEASNRAAEVSTPLDQHRKWAWWALGAGNVSTARKQAMYVLRRSPLSAAAWRLMYCAARGY